MTCNIIQDLQKLAEVSLTGSRIVPGGWLAGSDWDYLVAVEPKNILAVNHLLKDKGYKLEGQESYPDQTSHFKSWRKDDFNFLVSDNAEFIKRHRQATQVIKEAKITNKAERIAIFKRILYGD